MILKMKGYIYKISSPDDKINYYGLSTTNIYCRLYHHIKGYINYTKQKDTKQKDINFCSSYKIFEEYGIDDIHIKLIEKYDNITMEDLLNRETYYIQNYDCCNIRQKQKNNYNIKELTKLPKLSQEEIMNNMEHLKTQNFLNNEIIYINNLLNIFGFEINNNLIKLTKRINYYNVKDELREYINNYYKLFNLNISVNYNNILTNIDKILINYGLLLYKTSCKTKSIEDGEFKNDYKFTIVFIQE